MIWAMIVKETLVFLRDRGALASMFLLPVAFMTFFGLIFRGGGSDSPGEPPELALFTASDEGWGGRVARAVEESGVYRIRRAESPEAVRALVADKKVRAGLILPGDFDPLQGRPAELSMDTALSPQVLGPTVGAIKGLIGRAMAGPFARRADAVLELRAPPGIRKPIQSVDSFQVSVPGNAVLFIFFLSMGMALSFVEERRSGTWRRTLAAPARRSALLLAKLVPFFVMGLIQMTFYFGLGVVAFGMPIGGSLLALATLTVAVVFCAVTLGLLLASFGGTERQVTGFGTILVLVLGLCGGCMVPRLFMPQGVKNLGLFTPQAWALDGYYDVLIRSGTTVGDIGLPITVLVAFGLAFTAVGLLRMYRTSVGFAS